MINDGFSPYTCPNSHVIVMSATLCSMQDKHGEISIIPTHHHTAVTKKGNLLTETKTVFVPDYKHIYAVKLDILTHLKCFGRQRKSKYSVVFV